MIKEVIREVPAEGSVEMAAELERLQAVAVETAAEIDRLRGVVEKAEMRT